MSRRLILGLATALLVTACAGSAEPPAGSSPESGEPPWETVTSGITEDGVPLQVALEAFALAIGPLPGVETPDGSEEPIASGTGALRWTLGHWDELTTEQQAAVESYLRSEGPTGSGPVLAMTGQLLAAEPDEQALLELIAQVEDVIAQNLGRDLGVPIELHLASGLDDANAAALATGTDVNGGLFGPMARCEITLTKSGSELAMNGEAGAASAVLTSLFAHEVFHCFEMALSINLVDSYTRPPWVVEGLAEWVGETVAGGSDSISSGWPRWLADPQLSLYTREYSAIGFYAHLQEHGADVWSAIDHIIEGSDGGNEPAYLTAIAAAGPDVLPTWGPGAYRDPTRAPNWDQDGPGITLEKYPPHGDFPEVADGSQFAVSVGPLTADIWETELNAEVVTIGGTGFGMILLPDDAELVVDGTLSEVLCTNPEGCSCPEGSPGAGAIFRITAPGSARLGLTGHLDGSQLSIRGWSLDAFCQNQPELEACLFGQWVSVAYEAEGQVILPATGTGVTLIIDDTGRGSIDFDPSVPIMSQVGGSDVPVRIVQTGQAVFEVTPTMDGGVIDSAVGIGYSIHAEVDLGGGFVEAGEGVSLSGPSAGPGVTLTCNGDTLVWTGAGGVASYEFFRISSKVEPVPEPPPDAVPLGESGEGGGGEGGGLPEPPPDWGLGLDACALLSLEDVQAYIPEATQPAGEDEISSQLLHQCTYLPALSLQVTPPQPPEFTGDAAEGIGLEVVPIEGIGDWAQAFVYPDSDTVATVSAGSSQGTVSITPYNQVVVDTPEYLALLDLLEKALAGL